MPGNMIISVNMKKISKAFLTVRFNETQGFPVDVNYVHKKPSFTDVLEDVFVVSSPYFKYVLIKALV